MKKRKSNIPLPTIAWWGFQTLEFIAGEMHTKGEDFVSIYRTLDPYMKDRGWSKSERSDVIGFMLHEGWIHRKTKEDDWRWFYVVIDPTGRRELESPKQLQGLAIVNPVAELSRTAGQRELLSQLALALSLDSRTTENPEIRTRAEQMAHDLEIDSRSTDHGKTDFKMKIEMVKDFTQIAANLNSTLPLAHHLLSVLLR